MYVELVVNGVGERKRTLMHECEQQQTITTLYYDWNGIGCFLKENIKLVYLKYTPSVFSFLVKPPIFFRKDFTDPEFVLN